MNRNPQAKTCLVCKELFTPDPRVGDRQKVCKKLTCRLERKRLAQNRWVAQNPDYFKGRYPQLKETILRYQREKRLETNPKFSSTIQDELTGKDINMLAELQKVVDIQDELKRAITIYKVFSLVMEARFMFSKTPVCPERVRRIVGSFSWLDHRLISDGFLRSMSRVEIPLYFFLVLVGDKRGLSFYADGTVCELLKIGPAEYLRARELLIERSLIAYKKGLFQVLQLPEKNIEKGAQRTGGPFSLKEVINKL